MLSVATAPAVPQGAAAKATAAGKAVALAATLARLDAQYSPRPPAPPSPPPVIDYGPEIAARAALARTHSALFDARTAHHAQPTPATAAAHQAARAAYQAAEAAFFATPAGTRLLQTRAAYGRPWSQIH